MTVSSVPLLSFDVLNEILDLPSLTIGSFKPGFHMSGKSQAIGDFTVSRLSQILPTYENSKS